MMATKKGDYLGGIMTLEDLRIRCFIDPDTGCWVWRGGKSQGSPRVCIRFPDGSRKNIRGRRAALTLAKGAEPSKNLVAFAKTCCTQDLCCNPDHSRLGSRDHHGQWLRHSGKGSTPAKRASAQAMAPAKRKMTAADVIEIRASTESTYQLAKRLGRSQFAVWSARIGKSWKHVPMAGNSVFTWRPS